MAVTLINVFSVHHGKEHEFVKWWQDVKTNITSQQGFISGKFYRSIEPGEPVQLHQCRVMGKRRGRP